MSIAIFREQVLEGTPLRIRGGGTKDFLGGPLTGTLLETHCHTGIISYEPEEQIVTARAGTTVHALEAALIENKQRLLCSPPSSSVDATLGGMIASGLAGPDRMARGGVRDHLLGVTIMDGAGRIHRFGGQVMKNVAGFDVSRLMAGSMGTLGLILEASIRIGHQAPSVASRVFDMHQEEAMLSVNRWLAQGVPIVASCWSDGVLRVKLEGLSNALKNSLAVFGGDQTEESGQPPGFWERLQKQELDFFVGDAPLWRLVVPPTTPPLDLPSPVLIEWHGAQRWFRGELSAEAVDALRTQAARLGGHLTRYRGGDRNVPAFQRHSEPVMAIHKRIKQVFDPKGIFNPGRLYPDF